MESFIKRIEELITSANGITGDDDYKRWVVRIKAFLEAALGAEAAEKFGAFVGPASWKWKDYCFAQIGHLEGLAHRLEADGIAQSRSSSAIEKTANSNSIAHTSKVFVVHGHDIAAKESVARFLEKLRLEPVILHEQANEGRTIIEKFEAYADVGFAVVLFTPDDVGAAASQSSSLQPRARQNVVLELGYFTGKLGRQRVCALFKPGMEVPSDLHGVLFQELDASGVWRTKLAQELVQAGLQIDLQGLLQH
jgi:predicted nucleotide-binding protein